MSWYYWCVSSSLRRNKQLTMISVTNYDNPASLAVAVWPYCFTPIATACTSSAGQVVTFALLTFKNSGGLLHTSLLGI